jgi:hypothetical protein
MEAKGNPRSLRQKITAEALRLFPIILSYLSIFLCLFRERKSPGFCQGKKNRQEGGEMGEVPAGEGEENR